MDGSCSSELTLRMRGDTRAVHGLKAVISPASSRSCKRSVRGRNESVGTEGREFVTRAQILTL